MSNPYAQIAANRPPAPTSSSEETFNKFCHKCGTKASGGNFCAHCGTKLEDSATALAPVAAAAPASPASNNPYAKIFANYNTSPAPTAASHQSNPYTHSSYNPYAGMASSSYPAPVAPMKISAEDAKLKKEFDIIDASKDGSIDRDDLKKRLGRFVPESFVNSVFSMVDKNSDGKIDFNEYKAIRKQLGEIPGLVVKN